MRQLVAHNVDGDRETVKVYPVTVAEQHLRAVPLRVVPMVPDMDRSDQIHAVIVNRITTVNITIEIESSAQAVIGFIDCEVPAWPLAFASNQRTRQARRITSCVNQAVFARRAEALPFFGSRMRNRGAPLSDLGVERKGLLRQGAFGRGSVPGDSLQNVRRYDVASADSVGVSMPMVHVFLPLFEPVVKILQPSRPWRAGHDLEARHESL